MTLGLQLRQSRRRLETPQRDDVLSLGASVRILRPCPPLITNTSAKNPPATFLSCPDRIGRQPPFVITSPNHPPPPQPSSTLLNTPASLPPHLSEMTNHHPSQHCSPMQDQLNETVASNLAMAATSAAGFSLSPSTAPSENSVDTPPALLLDT